MGYIDFRVHQRCKNTHVVKCYRGRYIVWLFALDHWYTECRIQIMNAPPPSIIQGGPKRQKRSKHGTVDFLYDFALINSYSFSSCWKEHLFLIIITPRSSNLVENF